MENIFNRIRQNLDVDKFSDNEHKRILEMLDQMENKQVNLLIVGATGSGKSSTINSLFNMEVAKVGVGVDPETKDMTQYQLENLIVWDTPGFGDNDAADAEYSRQIVTKIEESNEDGKRLIDVVLVVLDAATKDL